jgi:SAM-dependent methyltransferase
MARPSNISLEAILAPKRYYNLRFQQGYMEGFDYDIYEACRLHAIKCILQQLNNVNISSCKILDYGCGRGRYIGVLRNAFFNAQIFGCDISEEGLNIARREYPETVLYSMDSESVEINDNSFDIVISVEVFEHVQNVQKAAEEIGRVLKPGGTAIITTPCANRFSLEWFMNWVRDGFESSPDGFGRFATDEPGHLRRLNDRQLISLCGRSGLHLSKLFYRAHLFTTMAERLRVRRALPTRVLLWVAMLDWYLFKHLPNGATMLAVFTKGVPRPEQ